VSMVRTKTSTTQGVGYTKITAGWKIIVEISYET